MESWRIAIVDDDRLVRKSLDRLLRSFGYDVLTFPSGDEFLDTRPDDAFTCLIADLCMPGMSGTELYQRLLNDGNRLPTIFMSAHEEKLSQAKTQFPEADEHLHKPFNDDQLLGAIRNVVSNHSRV